MGCCLAHAVDLTWGCGGHALHRSFTTAKGHLLLSCVHGPLYHAIVVSWPEEKCCRALSSLDLYVHGMWAALPWTFYGSRARTTRTTHTHTIEQPCRQCLDPFHQATPDPRFQTACFSKSPLPPVPA